jgi:hypothetical protein
MNSNHKFKIIIQDYIYMKFTAISVECESSSVVAFTADKETLNPSCSSSLLSNLSNSRSQIDGTTLDK